MRILVFTDEYYDSVKILKVDSEDEKVLKNIKEVFIEAHYNYHKLTLDVEGEISYIDEKNLQDMKIFLDRSEGDIDLEEKPEFIEKIQFIRKALNIY